MKRTKRWVHTLFAGAYVLLSLVALLGALAPWVGLNLMSWIQVIPPILSWLIPVHIFAMLAFAIRRRFVMASLALLALAVAVWIGSKDLVWRKAAVDTEASLRVVSFNVGTFDFKAEKINDVAHLLREVEPDIITFQEFRNHELADGRNAMAYMAEALGLPNYRFLHLPVHVHGAAIFSRFPIENLDTLYMPEREINSGILATLETHLGRVGIGNVHLSSFQMAQTLAEADGVSDKIQALYHRGTLALDLQAEKVKQVLTRTRNYPYPLILTGDLNSAPHTWITRQFSQHFQDSFLAAESGSKLGWTYPMLGPLGVRIDYQFASPEWQICSHEVIRSDASDHYAVLAAYLLQP